MVTRFTSWRQVMVTFTMPAPAWPSTSMEPSSSCIFCMFSCICWACFIRLPNPPLIICLLLLHGFDG